MTIGMPPATTRDESPAFFGARGQRLFGIVTHPTTESLGVAVVVLSGGGIPVSTNRNRLSVRLCRHAASLGFHAMRFDYHGVGESEGVAEAFRLGEPFVDDLLAAVRHVSKQGATRVILVGSCFGARTALSAAPRIEGLEGVVMISAPIRDFEMGDRVGTRLAATLSSWDYVRRALRPQVIRGLLDPDRRRSYIRIIRAKWRSLDGRPRGKQSSGFESSFSPSHAFIGPLNTLARRRVPVLLIYGDEEDLWEEFERAKAGRLGDILASGEGTIKVDTLPGKVHGFTRVDLQDALLERISGWLDHRIESITTRAG